MVACPSCRTENPDAARFCMGCGSPLRQAPTGVERKVVTALICDLVGSTELGDTSDPEDVDDLLRAYHAIARRRIEAYGGTVEKFIGDAIVAVFGIPVAHEDDAERAVRAAQRILEDLQAAGLGIHVRIGIQTGETVVRGDVDPASGEGFITGDALNIAARLQSAADIDGILAGEATRLAASSAFAWEDAGERQLKGRAAPLRTWRPGAPVRERPAEATPFVGRDEELAWLLRHVERACGGGRADLIALVAEPGMGKSRLLRELERRTSEVVPGATWRQGRCLPYGDGVTFWALGEVFAAHAGIRETDDQEAIARKLDAAIHEPDDGLRAWITERVAPLVGLDLAATPPVQAELFAAWRRLLAEMATDGPLVLVIEDLHWADRSLIEFLLDVRATVTDVPMLVVVTARPELAERHPGVITAAGEDHVLTLRPLPDWAVSAILASSLGNAAPDTRPGLVDRAAGSPLFAEQLAAMLAHPPAVDERGSPPAIPPTILGLLAARIDALAPGPKSRLLDASVVGRIFWPGAVAAVGGSSLEETAADLAELVVRGLVRLDGASGTGADAEHQFWHALLRDAAYSRIPRRERMQKHARAAAWIAARSADAPGRTAEIVADHWASALELAEATGDARAADGYRDARVDGLIAAATQAMRTTPRRALEHLERARALIGTEDERLTDVLVMIGRACTPLRRHVDGIAALEAARERLLRVGGAPAAARVAPTLANLLGLHGQPDRAIALLEEARDALADRPPAERIDVLALLAWELVLSGRLAEGSAVGRETVALADAVGLLPPPRALMAVGGDDAFGRAIEVADQLGDIALGSIARFNHAVRFLGHPGEMIDGIRASSTFDADHGIDDIATSSMGPHIRLVFLDEWDDHDSRWRAAIERALAVGDHWTAAGLADTLLAMLVARGDDTADAEQLHDRLVQDGMAEVSPGRAELAIARGDLAAARAAISLAGEYVLDADSPWAIADLAIRAGDRALAEALAGVFRRGAPTHKIGPDAPRLVDAINRANEASLLAADGDHPGARGAFADALEAFDEFGWKGAARFARIGLARSLIAQGRRDEAVPLLEAARASAAAVGFRRELAEIDRLLGGGPAVASADAPTPGWGSGARRS